MLFRVLFHSKVERAEICPLSIFYFFLQSKTVPSETRQIRQRSVRKCWNLNLYAISRSSAFSQDPENLPRYKELISMQLFRVCSRRPSRLFLKHYQCTPPSMQRELGFWIILLLWARWKEEKKKHNKGGYPAATRVEGKIPRKQMPTSMYLVSGIYIQPDPLARSNLISQVAGVFMAVFIARR